MTDEQTLQANIPDEMAGLRLDQALAQLFPQYSRSRLQQWIKGGRVCLDAGVSERPRAPVQGGELVTLNVERDPEPQYAVTPAPIALDCVYEDAHLMVINKPSGLVTHPAVGNWGGTLQNALVHRDPALSALPRAGIVHRLDKETSGLMVVAKTLPAHKSLVDQLQARSVKREYLALVQGGIVAGATVENNIGRHPVDRKRMAVVSGGKPAITHYRVQERFGHYTLLRVSLETGRTHQIRVHMAHIRHPIVGDPVYGGRFRLPPGASETLVAALQGFKRQALHATRLGLIHPDSGEALSWEAAAPPDMLALLDTLRAQPRPA